MVTRVAINGFGRIGRCILRAYAERPTEAKRTIQIVAINTASGDVESMIHLLKYDSTHGIFTQDTRVKNANMLTINDEDISVSFYKEPSHIPWSKLGVDLVLECSGAFNAMHSVTKHIDSGAKFVLVSAPCKGCENTIICGINDEIIPTLLSRHEGCNNIMSAGSCTTNALIPILHPIHQNFSIETGFVTTIHAYTSDQNLLDGMHISKTRARAAACSIIPTSTGVNQLVSTFFPDLAGKINATAIRVPVQNVSLIDFTFRVRRPTTKTQITNIMAAFAKKIPHILSINEEELVSVDFNHTKYSAIFDATQTYISSDGLFCRVAAWYDNEWGFANRMLDIASKIAC